MFETVKWWINLRGHANFWDWMRANFNTDDLQEFAREATDGDLGNPYEPLDDLTMDQMMAEYSFKRAMVKSLYRRYGSDIWHACMGECGEQDLTVFSCFARLALAKQVDSPSSFEEFLVRNAIKRGAQQLLKKQEGSSAMEEVQ
jgi:hypothetical protein